MPEITCELLATQLKGSLSFPVSQSSPVLTSIQNLFLARVPQPDFNAVSSLFMESFLYSNVNEAIPKPLNNFQNNLIGSL